MNRCAHTQTLSDLFAFAPKGELNVSIDGQAEVANGQLVSGNFHTGLGVQMLLGRAIVNDNDQAGANPVAVISHRYWQRRFGFDQAVVGKTVNVNGVPVTLIGVTPPQFYAGLELGVAPDFSFPLALAARFESSEQGRSDLAQTLAWRFFGDENPVGRRFGFGSVENNGQMQIVGVARDACYLNPRRDVPVLVYLPYPQYPLRQVTFGVRTVGAPKQMLAALRAVVREVDRDLPLFGIKTQSEQVAQSLAQERFFPKLTSFFGLLALLLASIGLYGVMSYSIARRTQEIGIRMALGAQPGNVIKMILRE